MAEYDGKQMSDSMIVGLLLALTGGYLDAYTFLARGAVFANAQTGNVVLLGMHLADGEFGLVFHYLIPILAFILGVLFAELIRFRHRRSQRLHWRQVVILSEMLVLAIVSFLPEGSGDLGANTAISFVCALQVQSFRKVRGQAYANTMCTGNLRSGTEQLFQYIMQKDMRFLKKGKRYFSVIGIFILGAAIGGVVTKYLGVRSVAVVCAALAAVFIMMNWVPGEGKR